MLSYLSHFELPGCGHHRQEELDVTRSRKLLVIGAGILALGAGGVGIAQAVGGDSDEQATGPEAQRAISAAIEAVGGGRAAGVEREDEGGAAWEVEVVRDDGR